MLLFLLTAFTIQSNATRVIINGWGGQGYYYVFLHNGQLICKLGGLGPCPLDLLGAETYKTIHPMKDVYDVVVKSIEEGKKSDTFLFNDDLPVSWNLTENNDLTIDLKDTPFYYYVPKEQLVDKYNTDRVDE